MNIKGNSEQTVKIYSIPTTGTFTFRRILMIPWKADIRHINGKESAFVKFI